jgi:hypothetical protein
MYILMHSNVFQEHCHMLSKNGPYRQRKIITLAPGSSLREPRLDLNLETMTPGSPGVDRAIGAQRTS